MDEAVGVDVDEGRRDLMSTLTERLENLPGQFRGCNNGVEDEGYRHEYYISEMSHALHILHGLNKQRQARQLCDVIICVEGWQFPCHRNVLSACSPYFLAMFTGEMRESTQQQVTIEGVEPRIMKQLIDYAYTSDITITQENAQQLLSAANMVQILAVQDACCKFLEAEMDPTNCLGIHCFAEAHMCTPLSEKARKYTLEHFAEVVQYEELLLLSESKLMELIQSDDLNVSREDVVFKAVIEWVKRDEETRVKILPNVLQYVRLPLVDPYFLFDKVEEEAFLTNLPQCRKLIDEAKKFFVLKDRETELQSPRTKPRKTQAYTQLLVTIGGEIYNKNYLSSVDCFNLTESRWVRLKDLPFPRCHHGTVVANRSDIYIAGGFNKDKVVLNNVLRFETKLDKWIKVACMLTPRARHGMATLDGYIYAVGGYDGRSRIDTVEKYSTVENKWTFVASMGVALSRCEAVGAHGYLYVAGGTTEPNNQCVDIMQRYNPRTDTWETLASLPTPRCLGGLVLAMGQIFAVAGTEDMVRACKSITRYEPKTNSWIEMAQIIEARFDAGVAVVGDKIFVVSGHDGENSFFNSIEEYDIMADNWKTWVSTVLPYGRCRFGCLGLAVPDSI